MNSNNSVVLECIDHIDEEDEILVTATSPDENDPDDNLTSTNENVNDTDGATQVVASLSDHKEKKASRNGKQSKKGCCCRWTDCRLLQRYFRILSDHLGKMDLRVGYNTISVSRKDQVNGSSKISMQKKLVLSSYVRHLGMDIQRLPTFQYSADVDQNVMTTTTDASQDKDEHEHDDPDDHDFTTTNTAKTIISKSKKSNDSTGCFYFSVARHHYHPLLLDREHTTTRWTKPIDKEMARLCGISDEDKIPSTELYLKAPNISQKQLWAYLTSDPNILPTIQQQQQQQRKPFLSHRNLKPPDKMRPMAFIPSCGFILIPKSLPVFVSKPSPRKRTIERGSRQVTSPKDFFLNHNLAQRAVDHGQNLRVISKMAMQGGIGVDSRKNNNNNNCRSENLCVDPSVHETVGLLFQPESSLVATQSCLESWITQTGWLHGIRTTRRRECRTAVAQQQQQRDCFGLQSMPVGEYAKCGDEEFCFCARRWSFFRNNWRSQKCHLVAAREQPNGGDAVFPRCQECWNEFWTITETRYPEMFAPRASFKRRRDDGTNSSLPISQKLGKNANANNSWNTK